MILALVQDASVATILKEAGITPDQVKQAAQQIRGGKQVNSRGAEEGFDALSKYARDLTAEAESGKLDPVIGRDQEIRRCIRILSRRTKNNPVLIGTVSLPCFSLYFFLSFPRSLCFVFPRNTQVSQGQARLQSLKVSRSEVSGNFV